MTTKPRSPGQKAISISLPEETLDWLDHERLKINLSRSAYIRMAINNKSASDILYAADVNDTPYKGRNEK